MPHVMFSLWKPDGLCSESWRQALLAQCQQWTAQGLQPLHLMVVDAAVAAAHPQRVTTSAQPLQGLLGLELELDIDRQLGTVYAALAAHTARAYAYHVCAHTPMRAQPAAATTAPQPRCASAAQGVQRAPGMCQVALFQRPAHLSAAQWLRTWHEHHSFNAYALQSIYDSSAYTVVQRLHPQAPLVHAIVQEHYPPEAIGSEPHYYAAPGQPQLMEARAQALSASVCRFVDLRSLDSVLTSCYHFRRPPHPHLETHPHAGLASH